MGTCAGMIERDTLRAMTTTLRRSAPVFVTTDLGRALAHYERLGFTVQAYDDGDFYGYACRDGLEIHLAKVRTIDQTAKTVARTCGWTTLPRCRVLDPSIDVRSNLTVVRNYHVHGHRLAPDR